jgi:hypothetical protein
MRSISSSRRRHSSMFRADVHECVEAGDPYLGSYGYCASVRPSRFATHVETGRPHQIHARRMPHGARAVPSSAALLTPQRSRSPRRSRRSFPGRIAFGKVPG